MIDSFIYSSAFFGNKKTSKNKHYKINEQFEIKIYNFDENNF